MCRLPTFLADRRMLLLWDDCLVGGPEIGEAVAGAVSCWDGVPQAATGRLTAISDRIGDHLARATAEGDPDPTLARLFGDEGPQLIEF